MAKGRWIHSDEYCPGRPRFGRKQGRHYECSCGRIWKVRITGGRSVAERYTDWDLVESAPEAPEREDLRDLLFAV